MNRASLIVCITLVMPFSNIEGLAVNNKSLRVAPVTHKNRQLPPPIKLPPIEINPGTDENPPSLKEQPGVGVLLPGTEQKLAKAVGIWAEMGKSNYGATSAKYARRLVQYGDAVRGSGAYKDAEPILVHAQMLLLPFGCKESEAIEEATLRLTQVYFELHKYAEAVKTNRECADLLKACPDGFPSLQDSKAIGSLNRLVLAYYAQSDYANALKVNAELMTVDPDRPHVLNNKRAALLYASGDIKAAEQTYLNPGYEDLKSYVKSQLWNWDCEVSKPKHTFD